MFLRNVAYDFQLIPIHRPKAPVISVGNLTTGGTGKTPFVEYLVRYFIQQGMRTCVISRGYKRTTKGLHLVSDGTRVFGDAFICGDEPYQIANKFPQTIVIVDEKRTRAVDFALKRFTPGIIILDDGFQHRSIARNLDIVIIDGKKNLAKMPMLPAGQRRELLSGLRRADLLVFNHVNASSYDVLESLSKYSNAPSVGISYHAKELHPLLNGRVISIGDLREVKCLAFCGVGNPQAFRTTLLDLGIHIVDFLVYPDHYHYTAHDLLMMKKHFDIRKAEIIITTEKDAMRLRAIVKPESLPIQSCYFIEIAINIIAGEGLLKYALKEKINNSVL